MSLPLLGAGSSAPSGSPMDSVSRDATSLKYVPASSAEWDTTLSAAGVAAGAPSHLFLCQEGSGDLVDTIGGAATNLTAQNTPLYNQTLAGWSRSSVGFTDGGSERFIKTTGFADPSTSAYLALIYMATTDDTPATNRFVVNMSGGTVVGITSRTDGKYRTVAGANQSADSTNTFGSNTVRPVTLFMDPTGNVTRGGDDQELLTPTHADAAGIRVAIPNATNGGSAPTRVFYMAIWTGADAVTIGGTTANLKAVLQTLGWTIPWS